MRKEILIAIIIGFVLGLVITFGVWTANKAIKEAPPKEETTNRQAQEEATATPSPTAQEPTLTIISPEDNLLSDKEKIDISGKTTPGATVVILFTEGEKIIEADKQGGFSTEITLAGGSNEIKVSSFDKDGKEISKSITIVYSTAEI